MAKPAVLTMISGASTPTVSNTFVNNNSEICTLQISGTFASATVKVEGIVDINSGRWVSLATFDLTDLDLKTNGMSDKSLYRVGIAGILRIRISLTAINGGDITVMANFVDTEFYGKELPPSSEAPFTAYDLAVLGGYTGTQADYEAALADIVEAVPLSQQMAGIAQEAAERAASSATYVQNYAVSASNSASNAGISATNAAESAADAASSASEASDYATAAANSATGALNSAANAENSAVNASASSSNAAVSASNAATSASGAANSAVNASSSAANASVSASNAAASASSAATSATAAQNAVGAIAPSLVTEWLNENVDPVGSAVVVDSSLSISGAAADAKVTGNKIATVKSTVDSFFTVPYVPSNISFDENGKIALEQGYISATTGATGAASSGKYYRSQVGANGLNSFLRIGNKPLYITCDVDFAQWTCWSYSGDTGSTATHSNTDQKYQLCSEPIFIPHNETDSRFAFSLRTLGTSDSDRPAFTQEQLTTLKNSIKFWVATDDSLSITGAAADAKTVGNIADDNAVDVTKNIPSASSSQYGTTLAFQRGGEWTKTGNATQTKFLTFVSASDSEKYGFIAGKSYYVDFTSSARSESTYDSIELLFYKNINGVINTNAIATFNGRRKQFGIVTMPSLEDGFTGITIRLRTKTNAPINASGTIKIYTAFPNQILSTAVKSLTRHSIAFFGDSIMSGANGNDETTYRNLPYIIAHNLSANYYNYGVSSAGYVTLGTGNVNAYDIISGTSLSSFDTIVICFGVNDGFKPIGTYDSTNEAECLGQFNKIIAYLGTNYPSIRIIVVAPFNGRNVGTFPKYWYGTVPSTAYSRGTLSDTLKQACEYYNIPYIEQKDGPINGYSINTLIGTDGVHPSQAGYDALGAWLSGEIARLIC